ncbi:MAG: hypothetical protein OQK73_10455 [Gammaproteobacteria bacterium]|nr:hypothetical protein [Gammaproteobacteria bacterium]
MRYAMARKAGLFITLLLVMINVPVVAESLTLKSIMQQLGKDFARLNQAILVEDYPEIEQAAIRIAEHPQPGFMEKMSMLAKVGTDVGQFKEIDEVVHKASMAIHAAAGKQDLNMIIENQNRVFNGCMQCHASFRKKLMAVDE